jgi:hypothetical protein
MPYITVTIEVHPDADQLHGPDDPTRIEIASTTHGDDTEALIDSTIEHAARQAKAAVRASRE